MWPQVGILYDKTFYLEKLSYHTIYQLAVTLEMKSHLKDKREKKDRTKKFIKVIRERIR